VKTNNFQKILIVRTDRIGDVLLTTPLIKALRNGFPNAHIAMMVRPYAGDVVLGNPYINEVIIYDKYGSQRSFLSSLKFALDLRKRKFDLAIIAHPTNRAHWISYVAQIKRRVGFNRKLGFLLTDRIEHRKQEGKVHELDYTLDFIHYLGLKAEDKKLFMPIRKDSEIYIKNLLTAEGVTPEDKLIAIHPGASCLSKIWKGERFAEVANKLSAEFGMKVVLVAGPCDINLSKRVKGLLHCAYIDASGKTTVSQLGSLLRRCSLFISNDSGPVHIAQALDVPTVAIFGRAQAGLSPRRWGPTGEKSMTLHKDVGCKECLAHNCQREFACLNAISVEKVLEAARELLSTYLFDRT